MRLLGFDAAFQGGDVGRQLLAGLDVRPAAEYAAGHVAGAVSIPAGELPARLAGLPRDKEIVAYCRGRFCVMSLDAVRLLRRHGYRARPMDGGLPEWRDEGMPTAAA